MKIKKEVKKYFSSNKKTHKHKLIYLLPLICLLILIDNLTKYWALKTLYVNNHSKTIHFIYHFLDFTYVNNPGLAFSSWKNSYIFAILISAFVVFVVLGYFIITRTKFLAYPLSFIVAGGCGNLINRTWNHGYVSDFIKWGFNSNISFFNAVFNLADSFITCGAIAFVVLFIFYLFFWPKILLKREKQKNAKL